MADINKLAGWVYLIQCGDYPYFKIGVSGQSPQNRLEAMQTGTPFLLKIVAQAYVGDRYTTEYELHRKYIDRIHRSEWYCLDALSVSQVVADMEEASFAFVPAQKAYDVLVLHSELLKHNQEPVGEIDHPLVVEFIVNNDVQEC